MDAAALSIEEKTEPPADVRELTAEAAEETALAAPPVTELATPESSEATLLMRVSTWQAPRVAVEAIRRVVVENFMFAVVVVFGKRWCLGLKSRWRVLQLMK